MYETLEMFLGASTENFGSSKDLNLKSNYVVPNFEGMFSRKELC